MTHDGPINVLIVEDNPMDVLLLKESLSAVAECDFQVVSSGDAAFELLARRGAFSQTLVPDLAVIDLNLPGRDGAEILDLIRSNADLQHLVVAVVSSSPRDIAETKVSRADRYVTKPLGLDEFLKVGEEILDCYRQHLGERLNRVGSDEPV